MCSECRYGYPLGHRRRDITLTAFCEKCHDLFTVWGRMKGHSVFIEPQFRIRFSDGKEINGRYLTVPPEGLYHYCGGRLRFYPDFVK